MADDNATPMTVRFDLVDPLHPDAVWALGQYFAELDRRFPDGFDPGDTVDADAHRLRAPVGCFVVVRQANSLERHTIGCAGLQTLDAGIGELKRMWLAPWVRRRGVGKRLLTEMEARSRALGHRTLRLDTNANLPEAVALYQRAGYRSIERYNDNPYPDFFFEKSVAEGS